MGRVWVLRADTRANKFLATLVDSRATRHSAQEFCLRARRLKALAQPRQAWEEISRRFLSSKTGAKFLCPRHAMLAGIPGCPLGGGCGWP